MVARSGYQSPMIYPNQNQGWDSLFGTSQFQDQLDFSRVGQPKMDSGGLFNRWGTQLGMSDTYNSLKGVGQKVNDFVQDKAQGWGNVLGGLSTVMGLYTGWKSMGLDQDKFDFSKDAWNKDYQAQAKDYENNLRDKWAATNTWGSGPLPDEQTYVNQRKIG